MSTTLGRTVPPHLLQPGIRIPEPSKPVPSVTLPSFAWLEKSLKEKIAAFNSRTTPPSTGPWAPGDLVQLTANEIERERTRRLAAELERRQVELTKWTERGELLPAICAAIEERQASLETELEAAKNKAAIALCDAGHRPEVDPHYAADPAAAERRFAFKVNQSADVRLVVEDQREARDHATHVMRLQKETSARIGELEASFRDWLRRLTSI